MYKLYVYVFLLYKYVHLDISTYTLINNSTQPYLLFPLSLDP